MTLPETATSPWIVDVLHGIGAPVTPNNVSALNKWANSEGTAATNNPLATTLGSRASGVVVPGSTNLAGNSSNVQNYPTEPIGSGAIAQTLKQPNYAGIRLSLISNAPVDTTVNAVNQSNWGSHIGPAASSSPASINTVSTSQGGNINNATTLTGLAGVLQRIDQLLNPAGPSGLKSLATLGTANAAQIAQLLAVRLLFTVGFMGITYLGIKTLTGGKGGSVNIIENIQSASRAASRQSDYVEREEARRQTAVETTQSRADINSQASERRAAAAAQASQAKHNAAAESAQRRAAAAAQATQKQEAARRVTIRQRQQPKGKAS